MYSLRYGTLPIVRKVGGLADTVIDANAKTIATKTATGFVFEPATHNALLATVTRALKYFTEPKTWRSMQRTAMRQDNSWQHSAREYESLYTLAMTTSA
jgi:starch synthase